MVSCCGVGYFPHVFLISTPPHFPMALIYLFHQQLSLTPAAFQLKQWINGQPDYVHACIGHKCLCVHVYVPCAYRQSDLMAWHELAVI